MTPNFFCLFGNSISLSFCVASLKKICAWELLGANVLKPRHACAVKPEVLKSRTLEIEYSSASCLGADQKARGFWERDSCRASVSGSCAFVAYFLLSPHAFARLPLGYCFLPLPKRKRKKLLRRLYANK